MTENTLFQTDWFAIRTDACGEEYVACDDEVQVVALTADRQVLLAVEPSAAFGERTVLLPGGAQEPNVPPAQMANRELQEELGYRAARLDFLGELRPWSKYLAVRTRVYLARDLSESALPGDEAHEIGVARVPLAAFEALVDGGRLRDARAIAALHLARRFLEDETVSHVNKFEEYKLFIEDTARFTDRRLMVTNIYVAVNTILLSAVALLLTETELDRWIVAIAAYAVICGGTVVCLFWRQLIGKYKDLVGLRIDELRQMEDLPEMAGCQRMYHAEDRLYPRADAEQTARQRTPAFSDLERQLPHVFIALYIVFAVGIGVALVMGWLGNGA